VKATGEREVLKVKSMATQEIGLNEALAERRWSGGGTEPA
jgi:L-lactate dehydrogenase complex protein LldF